MCRHRALKTNASELLCMRLMDQTAGTIRTTQKRTLFVRSVAAILLSDYHELIDTAISIWVTVAGC